MVTVTINSCCTDFSKLSTECPLRHLKQEEIQSGGKAYLTYSIAPYHEHHLMVILRRHTQGFLDLNEEEAREARALL